MRHYNKDNTSLHQRIESLSTKKDEKVSWYVGVYFIASTANMTMKNIFPISEKEWSLISIVWGLFILFFMFRGLPIVLQRSPKLLLYSIITFLFLYIWSYSLIIWRNEPISVLTYSIGFPTLAFWIPVGVYSCSVKKTEVLYHVLLKSSYIISGLLVLCFLFRSNNGFSSDSAKSYSMFFGYTMAFSSLLQLNEFFRRRDSKFLWLFIVQFVLIIIYANRGALLSVAFFVAYKIIIEMRNQPWKVFWIFTFCLGGVFVVLFAETIASFLLDLLKQYGLESRTLTKMASSSLAESKAREILANISWKMINERPLLGWGIGGECYSIMMKISPGSVLSNGFSPHNGILQNMMYFGVIIGTIVNFLLIWPLFMIHKIKDSYLRGIILVSCSAYFITSLWSSCDLLLKPAVAIYLFGAYYYKNNKKTIFVYG